jgi:cysteine-rich repeat protein
MPGIRFSADRFADVGYRMLSVYCTIAMVFVVACSNSHPINYQGGTGGRGGITSIGSGGLSGLATGGYVGTGGAITITIPSDPCLHGACCGDGRVDLAESCDDGNTIEGDGCDGWCWLESDSVCPTPGQACIKASKCGSGIVTSKKVCDDGNTMDGDGCSRDCNTVEHGWRCPLPGKRCIPACGDGILIGGELCDDGNNNDGDGCSSFCLIEPGYRCPVVGTLCVASLCSGIDAGGACDASASAPSSFCGDGLVTLDEQCDDGNDTKANPSNGATAYGGCATDCKYNPYCGDGIVNGPEECDDGPANGASYGDAGSCSYFCTWAGYCGDGIVQSQQGEMCDLGELNGTTQGLPCIIDCHLLID